MLLLKSFQNKGLTLWLLCNWGYLILMLPPPMPLGCWMAYPTMPHVWVQCYDLGLYVVPYLTLQIWTLAILELGGRAFSQALQMGVTRGKKGKKKGKIRDWNEPIVTSLVSVIFWVFVIVRVHVLFYIFVIYHFPFHATISYSVFWYSVPCISFIPSHPLCTHVSPVTSVCPCPAPVSFCIVHVIELFGDWRFLVSKDFLRTSRVSCFIAHC